MDPNVMSAVIGAGAALVVAAATVIVSRRSETRSENKRIRDTYLNPLRLFVEEVHYRLEDLFRFPQNAKLLAVSTPADVSSQPAEWFNAHGCYLASTCYLTGSLFAAMKRVREGIPYMRLRRAKDTELLTRMLRISHEFLYDMGIFYLIQHSIGEQMWDSASSRIITYREFCEALQNPARRVWFDRLLLFYIDVGNGGRLEQIRRAQKALEELSNIIDKGAAIKARNMAEETRWKARPSSPPLTTA